MAEDLVELQLFCKDVINFSLYGFDRLDSFQSHSILFDVSIAKAVVGLQVYLRDELKLAFLTSIGYITESLPSVCALGNIKLLLGWHYFNGDIFNFMFANLATLVEMILFLDTIGLEFPADWFPKFWSHIYWYRIKDELLRAGGWSQLIIRAETRYELSGIFSEMRRIIATRRLNPYGSVGIHSFEFVDIYDGYDPRVDLFRNRPRTRATVLSISMMDVIYNEEMVRDWNITDRLYAEITEGESIRKLLTRPRSYERLV